MTVGEPRTHPFKAVPRAGTAPEPRSATAAWQPITFNGVAAFAMASRNRLLLVQCCVALAAAGSVAWCVAHTCLPALRQAIQALPDRGLIHRQELLIERSYDRPLAETRVLAVAIDLDDDRLKGVSSDLVLELHRYGLEICSLPGCLVFSYPRRWTVELNRKTLGPWLDAWTPALLFALGGWVVLSLLAAWSLMAALYAVVPWAIAYYSDRQITWQGSRRLAGAAVLPGALCFTIGIVLYGAGVIDLVRLLLLVPLHLVVGWIYLALAPRWLGAVPGTPAAARNPFSPPPEAAPSHPADAGSLPVDRDDANTQS